MTVHQLEPWVTKKEIAVHLGCSVSWVEKRMAQGMPYAVIAGRVKVRASEVEAWLDERGHIDRKGAA